MSVSKSVSMSSIPISPTTITSSGTNQYTDTILSLLQRSAAKHKGTFNSSNTQWAFGNEVSSLSAKALLTNSMHWNTVNLIVSQDGKIMTGNSLLITANIQECNITLFEFDMIVRLYMKETRKSFYFKFSDFNDYMDFIGALSVWSNLKQSGITNKWSYINHEDIQSTSFKPITESIQYLVDEDNNQWATATITLEKSGIINLTDREGKLIISADICALFESEVRILHQSVMQSPNTLFLAPIQELRQSHGLEKSETFLINKSSQQANKLMIRFDEECVMKNWYVNLLSFCKLEYVGEAENRLRINKVLNLEILDLQKLPSKAPELNNAYLYCELVMWNKVWFRTCIVKTDEKLNTFWKDLVNIKLPISSTNNVKLLIKKAGSLDVYNEDGDNSDEIIGSCIVHIHQLESDNIHRINITNIQNQVIGELMINLSLNETKILPVEKYKSFAKMISTSKISLLITEIENKVDSSNLETWSNMLLDIYQEMNRVDEFFETIMKYELVSASSKESQKQAMFKYTTIFRGNSILSKSLEKYTIRIGGDYLKQLLGDFIDTITKENLCCVCDPKIEPETYKDNYTNLLNYVELLWERVKLTTNDIPASIKAQWKSLRSNVELSVDGNYNDISLNALSSFIFLRFICPAILNPKLYNLSNSHQSGNASRTLVFIAKVFMTFSNRGSFQAHKEPYLVQLNEDFLEKHRDELLIYFDKVTSRKIDFNEKILNCKEEIEIKKYKVINPELPRLPYLIDKYANLAKLSEFLDHDVDDKENNSTFSSEVDTDLDSYQIGDIDDTRLESDFLSSIIEEGNEAFDSVLSKHEFTIKDIKKQARKIMKDVNKIEELLEKAETISDYGDDTTEFVDKIIRGFKLKLDGSNYNVVFDSTVIHGDRLNHELIDQNVEFFEKVKSEVVKRRNRKSIVKKPSISSLNNHSEDSTEHGRKRSFIKSIFKR